MQFKSTILVLALTAAAVCSSALPKKPVEVAASLAAQGNGFNYAVDVVNSLSQSNFNCFFSYGYKLAFLRIYGPNNNGQTDSSGVNNVFSATNAGLAYEVFVTPSTTNVKSGGTQFNEAYNYATSQGLKLNRIWLQVTSPINWGSSTYSNVNFINNFISTANNRGINVGIYTNWYDWSQITNSASINPYALWYWNANGVGKNGETSKDASDFVSFGPFKSATIKQFGIGESLCQTTVNLNIYASNGNERANSVDMKVLSQAVAKH